MGAVAVSPSVFDRPSSTAVNPSMKPYALCPERAAALSTEIGDALITSLLPD
jgi:hypothetical protein